MNRVSAIALAVLVGAAFTSAQAQYSARSVTPKVPGITTASGAGGFQGSDDCSAPHTAAGVGPVSGVPFTTGTTGTAGQNEANCYVFTFTGIDGNVWYDWTAAGSDNARVTTCGGTTVDTKIAVWPDNSPASCPPDGTSIACNDDTCALQSSVSWSVTAGTTYTIQLGTFPGATGGSGTFNVEEFLPPPCGAYDDGTTENALGLTAGGETGWLHVFTCGITTMDSIETAYGTAMFPGSVTNGANSRLAIYDEAGTDPGAFGTPVATAATVVVNGDTDILNKNAMGTVDFTNNAAILATVDQVAGQFPGPIDQDNPTPNAWIIGSTLGPGSMDIDDLGSNNIPPQTISSIGFDGAWLLRADNTGGPTGPGVALCFGDGNSAACGCSNEIPATMGGCGNSLGVGGTLSATGTADTTADTIDLSCSGVRTQPGLFFQANNTIGGGTGATFGDGIRCCGMSVVRLEVVVPPGPEPATATMTVTITATGPPGTVNPGDKKCYQYWYRDPGGGNPCGGTNNFNLSNAVSITWI